MGFKLSYIVVVPALQIIRFALLLVQYTSVQKSKSWSLLYSYIVVVPAFKVIRLALLLSNRSLL